MFAPIEGLLILQDKDRRLSELAEQIEQVPKEEARAKSRLSGDEAAVAEAKKKLQLNGVEAKNLELDVETRKTTIIRLRKQQFETRKNEEFQALGHEIERYGEEIDGLETRQLELMEKTDVLQSELDAAMASLHKSQQVVEEDLADLIKRKENLEKEKAQATQERQQLAAKVDEELLELYERLLVKKKGVAVAPELRGQCG
ncbi:MAG: zinc ribbon domain-containing protein, partial [Verrucomicrobiales bacterium]